MRATRLGLQRVSDFIAAAHSLGVKIQASLRLHPRYLSDLDFARVVTQTSKLPIEIRLEAIAD